MSTAAKIPVHANQIEPAVDEVCHSWWSCQLASVISEGWILLTAGALAVALLVAVAYLRSARSVVAEERSRTAAEREAFLSFGRRVAEISTATLPTPDLPANGGVSPTFESRQSSDALEEVRQAYRETVMAVPHYEEEYDEPIAENMTIEFGQDVTESIRNSTQLSPLQQQILVAKAKRSADERGRLMNSIDQEVAYLRDAEDPFTRIDNALADYRPDELHPVLYQRLVNRWDELDSLEGTCCDVLEERQRQLQTEPMTVSGSDRAPSLFEYLYGPLEVDYPVLASGTTLLDRIQNARQKLVREACNMI